MHIKIHIPLLSILMCLSLRAGDSQAPKNPFMQNNFFTPKAQSEISQEELNKLLLMRAVKQEHNIETEENDILFQAQLRLFCKQIHEQTGTLLTPSELFNNMNTACEDIGALKIFCAEHGLRYITPVELYKAKNKAQEKNKYFLIAGAFITTPAALYLIYKNLPEIVRPFFVFALQTSGAQVVYEGAAQVARQKNMPVINDVKAFLEKLSEKQQIAVNVGIDSALSITGKWMEHHQTAPLSEQAQQYIRDKVTKWIGQDTDNSDNFLNVWLIAPIKDFIHPGERFNQLTDPEAYLKNQQNPLTGKDCAFHIAKATVNHALIPLACNLINRSPVLAEDAALQIGEFTVITKHEAITAALETLKELANYELTRHISDNTNKQDTDTTKLTGITAADVSNVFAHKMTNKIAANVIMQVSQKYTPSLFPEKDKAPELVHMGVQIAIPVVAAACATVAIKSLKVAGTWAATNIPSALGL